MSLALLFLILAAACFFFEAIQVQVSRLNLNALAWFFIVLSWICGGYQLLTHVRP